MRGGVLQLSRWGLLDQIIAAGTPPVQRTTFRYGDERVVISIKPSHGVDALYAPRRTVLDPLLVHAARRRRRRGATTRTAVTDLIMRTRPGGRRARRHARRTVRRARRAARDRRRRHPLDGRRAGRRARCRGWASTPPPPPTATGPISTPTATSGTSAPNACSGVIPTNDGQACVFAGASPKRIGRGGVAVLDDIVAEGAPQLAERLRRAPPRRKAREPGAAGPATCASRHGPGWALVGDAGYFKDPLSAHGLTDALRDAELLARAVSSGLGDDAALDDALERLPGHPRPAQHPAVRRRRPHRQPAMGRRRDRPPAAAAQLRHGRRGRSTRRASHPEPVS